MKISWLGHSSFFIETSLGTTLVTDPYDPAAVGYDPINIQPDIGTVSHSHYDHSYVSPFAGSRIIDSLGNFEIKDIKIEGILSFHDKQQGKARGENIIFKINADGITLVHFGDLGTLDIDYESIADPDVALVPVGGTFTLDAAEATELINKIRPRITIPMHYKTGKLSFDLEKVTPFISGKSAVTKNRECVGVSPQTLPLTPIIIVLDHLR